MYSATLSTPLHLTRPPVVVCSLGFASVAVLQSRIDRDKARLDVEQLKDDKSLKRGRPASDAVLNDLDLPSFKTLPRQARRHLYHRFWEVLSGEDTSTELKSPTAEARTAIRGHSRPDQEGLVGLLTVLKGDDVA